MDFDSSAKFISSLAKFLQSLCNGYVEFDNGVEVIGHIYLNVDTGKKIDYVLNEKVCKTDENSVTFISNSFHAQPAEKPKVEEKPKQNVPSEQETDSEIILMDDCDQYNDNVQLNNSTPHPKSKRPHGASKRPFSQSYSSNRPSSKASKYDSASSNPNGAHIPLNNSTNDSSFSLNVSGNITAASESDLSHLSQVFPESINDSSNTPDGDIKPILDNVMNVKEEYDPSASCHGDGNTYDEHGDNSFYSQDQSYESGNDQYYGHQDSHRSKMYMGDHTDGQPPGSTGDPQGLPGRCPVKGCNGSVTFQRSFSRHWHEKHERLIAHYYCAFCDTKYKRRAHLMNHVRVQHGCQYRHVGVGKIEQNANTQFIDPYPLTLSECLSLIKMPQTQPQIP